MLRWLPVALLFGCYDLPEGWEDATPVDEITQSRCQGDPAVDAYDTWAYADVSSPALIWLRVRDVVFREGQLVTAFKRVEGDTLQVLLQPWDRSPLFPAETDCFIDMDIDLSVRVDEPLAGLEVWARADDKADDQSLVEVPIRTP